MHTSAVQIENSWPIIHPAFTSTQQLPPTMHSLPKDIAASNVWKLQHPVHCAPCPHAFSCATGSPEGSAGGAARVFIQEVMLSTSSCRSRFELAPIAPKTPFANAFSCQHAQRHTELRHPGLSRPVCSAQLPTVPPAFPKACRYLLEGKCRAVHQVVQANTHAQSELAKLRLSPRMIFCTALTSHATCHSRRSLHPTHISVHQPKRPLSQAGLPYLLSLEACAAQRHVELVKEGAPLLCCTVQCGRHFRRDLRRHTPHAHG